jgi:hypothetical protein
MRSPAQYGSTYRPCLTRAWANERFCFTYWRTVAKDHTISLFGHIITLPKLPVWTNLAGHQFELHHRMDGRLVDVIIYVSYIDNCCLLLPNKLGY